MEKKKRKKKYKKLIKIQIEKQIAMHYTCKKINIPLAKHTQMNDKNKWQNSVVKSLKCIEYHICNAKV